jgi:hypothetical protein
MHVPPADYLTCEDYDWLKKGVMETELFTPGQKFDLILRWMEHTDPHCFDNKDANDWRNGKLNSP